jgi:ribosomal protein L34E
MTLLYTLSCYLTHKKKLTWIKVWQMWGPRCPANYSVTKNTKRRCSQNGVRMQHIAVNRPIWSLTVDCAARTSVRPAGVSRPAEQPAAVMNVSVKLAYIWIMLPCTRSSLLPTPYKNYLNVEQCGLYTHKFISNIQLRTFKERQFNNYKR